MRCTFALVVVLASACASTVGPSEVDFDASAMDVPAADSTAALDLQTPQDSEVQPIDRAVLPPDIAPGPDVARPPVVCAGTTCSAGEVCCQTTGRCFDPTVSMAACAAPPQDARSERTCASDADCTDAEYCISDQGLCLGAGHCQPTSNCGSCSGSGGGCTVCGCDGVNYPNPQTACARGVRVGAFAHGACGAAQPTDADAGAEPVRVPCGNASHCPSGQGCCAITGVCVDLTCAGCCNAPPPGTRFPCASNAQCSSSQYCRSEGCGTPGGCVSRRSGSDCAGEVDQVCGCNGRTYVNACWAGNAGTNVAHPGACAAP